MVKNYSVRTGLQRFMDRFPYWPRKVESKNEDQFEYLGVGAMMTPPVVRLSDNTNSIEKEVLKNNE